MIKGVIFDMGGVLIGSTSHSVYSEISKAFHVSMARLSTALAELLAPLQIGAWTEEEFWQQLSLKLKKPLPLNYTKLWRKGYIKAYTINKEVLALAVALRERGYRTCLLSNTIPSHSNFAKSIGIRNSFELSIISHEVGLRKPDPLIFRLALEKLFLNPIECVFIDDEPEFVRAAQLQGFNAVHYLNPKQLKEEFTKLRIF